MLFDPPGMRSGTWVGDVFGLRVLMNVAKDYRARRDQPRVLGDNPTFRPCADRALPETDISHFT